MINAGNLFAALRPRPNEQFTTLAAHPGAFVERIVSTGQTNPSGFWYDQAWPEWVVVLQGAADLMIEGESGPRRLGPGDWIELPAHVRHRVEGTEASPPTVWLAVHWKAPG